MHGIVDPNERGSNFSENVPGVTIEYHREGIAGPMRPAINVKDDNMYFAQHEYRAMHSLPSELSESIYQECVRRFWDDAQTISESFGYGTAYSEGRSGGWLVVENPPSLTLEDCQGMAASPYEIAKVNREYWKTFVSEIEALMIRWREHYAEQLETAAQERSNGVSRTLAREDLARVGI